MTQIWHYQIGKQRNLKQVFKFTEKERQVQMEESLVAVVVAIKKVNMNRIIILVVLILPYVLGAQNNQDSTNVFKKRVLESTEIDLLTSFYTQNGENAAVTGGTGSEQLNDFATNINIVIPLNDDDVLSIDATVSAYSSASSSNLNPFPEKSSDDDEKASITGSPWVASSGASKNDVWASANIGYSHSSDDRNEIFNANVNLAIEYDYTSFGAGIGFTKLFNQKNTELNLSANAYLDSWNPQYPIEIETYIDVNGNLNAGFFKGVNILNSNGNPIDKESINAWNPINTTLIDNKGRNTFSFLLGISQILTKRTQFSVFTNITYQHGWLANPMQRVYFSDIDNFYIGNASSIPNYTNPNNKDVFQLADDIERLPNDRLKIPVGIRLNHYVNEFIVIKTYYRYYFDDWGITSNTFNVELPIKIGDKFTIYPNYRFYNQSKSDHFAPFEQHVSTSDFYTSDYDLSNFTSNQLGVGIKYTDILTQGHIWKFGLKNITLNYNYYQRNTGLKAHIISLGAKFILDK